MTVSDRPAELVPLQRLIPLTDRRMFGDEQNPAIFDFDELVDEAIFYREGPNPKMVKPSF